MVFEEASGLPWNGAVEGGGHSDRGAAPGRLRSTFVAMLLLLSLMVVLPARTADAGTFPGWNGRIAFIGWGTDGDEIFTVNADGTGRRQVTSVSANTMSSPSWSPDGRRIAFSRNYDIWVMNANGTGKTNLTKTPDETELHPAWSPDGTKIAYSEGLGGDPSLHVMNADGSGDVDLGVPASTPEWSPDGDRIAFSNYDYGISSYEVYVVNTDGTGLTNLTNSADIHESDPGWSPDGTRLVFSEWDPNANFGFAGISLMDADGSDRLHVTPTSNQDHFPSFSPDGERIVFSNEDRIFVIDTDGSNRTRIVRGLQRAFEPDWQALTVTLATNKTEVNYRGAVTVTADLYHAGGTDNPIVSIYRRPAGQGPVLVKSAAVDDSGHLSAVVTLTKRTSLYATWAGDAGHPATSSPEVTVIVHAIVTGRLGGYYGVSGAYRLYHQGVDPRYTARVTPNHAGKRLYFYLERRKAGVWNGVASAAFRIRSDGSVTVFVSADLLHVGVPYRIHAIFKGDTDHARAEDALRYFKVTS